MFQPLRLRRAALEEVRVALDKQESGIVDDAELEAFLSRLQVGPRKFAPCYWRSTSLPLPKGLSLPNPPTRRSFCGLP